LKKILWTGLRNLDPEDQALLSRCSLFRERGKPEEGVHAESQSKAPVPVIAPMQRLLDQYRPNCGNPASGPIFGTMKGTPLSLNDVLNRETLPVLNACVCGKAEDEHENEDHKYERGARPEWHAGTHSSAGLPTNLHDLGVSDKTI